MKKLLILPVLFGSLYLCAQTNYALSLNGTNQCVNIGSPIASNSSYTKEAWVFITTTGGNQNIISSSSHPFWISGGRLQAGQANSYSRVIDAVTLPTNRWIHTAVTFDAATATMRLYKDAVLVSSATGVPAYTTEVNFIGSHAGGQSYLQGRVDEVRIWNLALSADQLKAAMFKGPASGANGLVSYFKCNENGGSVLTNSTGGANGTLQNAPNWVDSQVQFGANALSFDGSDDQVIIADHNSLDITNAITLEAWVYATKNTGTQNVINKSSNSQNNGYIFPRTDNGWTNIIVYLHIGGSWRTLSAPYPGGLNAWHHLAATYDGAMIRVYIDGMERATQAQTGTITINTNNLILGTQTGFSEFFGGRADEFRIWNVARTGAQLQAAMFDELDPTTQTGLVSYYTANQGVTAGANPGLVSLIDQKGANNGTITNFALTGASSNFVQQHSNIIVLPLEWLSFTLQEKNNNVELKWVTAQEEHTKDFVVEWKGQNQDWEKIGLVQASSNFNSTNEYTFVHTGATHGMNHYRILQRDLDGRSSYSETRAIRLSKVPGRLFTVLNNPIEGSLLKLQLEERMDMALYSLDGRMVWKKNLNAGVNDINIGGLKKGIYLLKNGQVQEKIVIK